MGVEEKLEKMARNMNGHVPEAARLAAEVFPEMLEEHSREGAFAMQMGDFMGRNALQQWEVFKNTKPGMTPAELQKVEDDADQEAQTAFDDYRKNLPRNVNMLASYIPVMPFAKFFLSIQPVLFKMMMDNPTKFLTSAALGFFGIPGLEDTIPGGTNMTETSMVFGFGGRVDPTPDLLSMAMTPPAYIDDVWEMTMMPFG